ncbi:MAG: hypothetical protein ACREN8_11025 [Candidatus Dormibacteraceae bacterium]
MDRNWDDIGIEWEVEDVSKQHGDHATDRVIIGKAQMPITTDLAKFQAHFGDACILGIMDGTSVRVMAQDVNRRMLQKGCKAPEIREAIYNRLKGVRNAGTRTVTVKTVKVYSLPNGTTYDGTDLVEYQQLYVSALTEQGVPAATAVAIAQNQTL